MQVFGILILLSPSHAFSLENPNKGPSKSGMTYWHEMGIRHPSSTSWVSSNSWWWFVTLLHQQPTNQPVHFKFSLRSEL